MDSPRPSQETEIRLNRYLAQCGIGSRRACERLIEEGVVAVDGRPVTQQGVVLNPEVQSVSVRGNPVERDALVHFMLNKPSGVLCTSSDPQGRKTVHDLLPDPPARIYTVGRLDKDSEGLILITNDGEFAHVMMHPRHHVRKTYRVWINEPIRSIDRRTLLSGVEDQGEVLRAASVGSSRGRAVYEVVLNEGRNRQIHRMFEGVNRKVVRLQRIAIGSLRLGRLSRGGIRPLLVTERRSLFREARGHP